MRPTSPPNPAEYLTPSPDERDSKRQGRALASPVSIATQGEQLFNFDQRHTAAYEPTWSQSSMLATKAV